MADKQSFTPEEWIKLLESPMLVCLTVSAAEPSGLWGVLKEAFASGSELASAKLDAGSNELIKAVVTDLATPEARSAVQEALKKRLAGAKPAAVIQRSLADLRDVSTILDVNAPGDSAAFKAWLGQISRSVAEASTEGGFLGFGGMRVSEAERGTLSDIGKALGTMAGLEGDPTTEP
jgi:hypothetical protein